MSQTDTPRADVCEFPAYFEVGTWEDRRAEAIGFKVTSEYAEICWLPVIGPSSLLLLRRLDWYLGSCAPVWVDAVELAGCLGLGSKVGRNSTLARTIDRLVMFDLARWVDGTKLEIRRTLYPVSPGRRAKVPASVQAFHEFFLATEGAQ